MNAQNTKTLWPQFIQQLMESVKPAVGCTEPIALALAAAKAAQMLSSPITRIEAKVSPNLMKNGMGVTVPGTGVVGLGIAAALGAFGGDAEAGLEVLLKSSKAEIKQAKAFLAQGNVTVEVKQPCEQVLYAEAKIYTQDETAIVAIAENHTQIVYIQHNDEIILNRLNSHNEAEDQPEANLFEHLGIQEIYDFAINAPIGDIAFMKQAAVLNGALSLEGLKHAYGLEIGRTLSQQIERGLLGNDLMSSIMIRSSAASDARMGGAILPAMSNSGSGNQGIAATLPVMVVAEHLKATDEQLIRALVLSHLSAIYIHSHFPPLSALCAASTASMGASAAMAWLLGGNLRVVSMAINSMIGDISGIICDGAANSCAMKVSSSASSAFKAALMAINNKYVTGTDGIVCDSAEQSIANIGALATNAMCYTDKQIIQIMDNKARIAALAQA